VFFDFSCFIFAFYNIEADGRNFLAPQGKTDKNGLVKHAIRLAANGRVGVL
jgi:hypothetical protein